MAENLLKVGITQGDTNGIAYELILKAFEDNRLFEFCIPVIYGSSKVLAYHRKVLNLPSYNLNNINNAQDSGTERLNIINVSKEEIMVDFGKPTPESAKAADVSIKRAIEDLRERGIDILLTTPATVDSSIYEQDQDQQSQQKVQPVNMLVNNSLRIGFATDKISLSEINSVLTKESLVDKIKALNFSLIHEFMITSPRIAVLSLNPGAGIKDTPGKEELEVIIPALKEASLSGIFCFGPYSADSFFGTNEYLNFDAILAIYYDQGMIAFQSITGGEGIKYTANLPFISAAPNQTPSFEKAGKNLCSPDSLRDALYLAIDIYRNREINKEIYKNPLKKQYFERGSDNEKLDLTKDED